jgi:hypothetical protein
MTESFEHLDPFERQEPPEPSDDVELRAHRAGRALVLACTLLTLVLVVVLVIAALQS